MSVKNSSNNSGAPNKCVVGNFPKKLINIVGGILPPKYIMQIVNLNHNLIFGHQMAIISMENKKKGVKNYHRNSHM